MAPTRVNNVTDLPASLGMSLPMVAAPMAGGPSTPELVIAAADAGGLGFLAAGYKTPEQLADQIATVRAATPRFGVNLFVPNTVSITHRDFTTYRATISSCSHQFDVNLPTEPFDDDDAWDAKVDLLASDPVPVVSFTFGFPSPDVIRRFQSVGSTTVQTVTSVNEATQAQELGMDALVVQAAAAGGHSATTTPHTPVQDLPLPDLVRTVAAAVDLPIFAAGGISNCEQIREVRAAGAVAAVVGTALLRATEAGTSAPHRAALADPTRVETVVTRAFSGRPARAIRNEFTDRFTGYAPLGFPAVHHLTAPLRKAATAAGNPEFVNLWAGTGFRHTPEQPAAMILRTLGDF